MVRHGFRAVMLAQALVLSVGIAEVNAAGDRPRSARAPAVHIDLLPAPSPDVARFFALQRATHFRHWLYVEVDGARTQAERWLHDAGFSLLEDRDTEGRHRYELVSRTLVSDWPSLQLHTRIGRPELSAGLRPRRAVPAFGLTVPGPRYTLQVEGMQDREFGWALIGSVRWSDASRRVQYGIALPLALRGGPAVGALLQLQMRLGH